MFPGIKQSKSINCPKKKILSENMSAMETRKYSFQKCYFHLLIFLFNSFLKKNQGLLILFHLFKTSVPVVMSSYRAGHLFNELSHLDIFSYK